MNWNILQGMFGIILIRGKWCGDIVTIKYVLENIYGFMSYMEKTLFLVFMGVIFLHIYIRELFIYFLFSCMQLVRNFWDHYIVCTTKG